MTNYRLNMSKRPAGYSKCENKRSMWNKIVSFKGSFSRK